MRTLHAARCSFVLPGVLLGLVACGGGGSGGPTPPVIDAPRPPDVDAAIDAAVDAPPAPMMVTVTGQALERNQSGSVAVAGATIAAHRGSDETTALATTTTDAQGNFTLVVPTGGEAIDGYLKATKAGYKETYLYPPAPIAADTIAPVNMITPAVFDLLGAFAQHTQQPGMGFIALVVVNGSTPQALPVAGATVSSTPAASVIRYSNPATGLPGNAQFTATYTDGLAYLFNLPGDGVVSVNAMRTGMTFKPHNVKAWKDQLTTTLVTP